MAVQQTHRPLLFSLNANVCNRQDTLVMSPVSPFVSRFPLSVHKKQCDIATPSTRSREVQVTTVMSGNTGRQYHVRHLMQAMAEHAVRTEMNPGRDYRDSLHSLVRDQYTWAPFSLLKPVQPGSPTFVSHLIKVIRCQGRPVAEPY